MGKRVVMQGNHAMAEATLRAGAKFGAGYPITPATEIAEYMSEHFPKNGAVYIQPESEIAVMAMLYGAGAAGVRAVTSTSSIGFSLMVEGLGMAIHAEVPFVVLDLARGGGPGLGGSLGPSQADYNQLTKGGHHGESHLPVLAPSTVQEAVTLTQHAFHLADKYRTPVVVLTEQCVGQSTEAIDFDEVVEPPLPEKNYIVTGAAGRASRGIAGGGFKERDVGTGQGYEVNEAFIKRLKSKYQAMADNDTMVETLCMDDAEVAVVAYGTAARIARTAIEEARRQGAKVGLIRPITLFPFPKDAIDQAADRVKSFLSIELSMGQMVEDIRLIARGRVPTYFYGRCGGIMPSTDELLAQIQKVVSGEGIPEVDYRGIWDFGSSEEEDELPAERSEAAAAWNEKAAATGGEVEGMTQVFKSPASFSRLPVAAWCAGCGYGIISRLIAEVVDEMGLAEKTILIQGSGCSGLNQHNWQYDVLRCLHGRAVSGAVGVKRVLPDRLVFTMSGDGDATNIGLADTVGAAIRGENVTVFLLNNSGFGETGGQMANTSILGQVTPTSPEGKSITDGYPIHLPEMISVQDGVAYLARVAVNSPAAIRQAKRCIRRALETQMAGRGFTLVEFLSMCPSGWRLKPLQTLEWLDNNLSPVHHLGEIKVPQEVAAPPA